MQLEIQRNAMSYGLDFIRRAVASRQSVMGVFAFISFVRR
jgi:hypothetical protein